MNNLLRIALNSLLFGGFVSSAFAFDLIEDSKNKLVWEERNIRFSTMRCNERDWVRATASRSFATQNQEAVPFYSYNIAVPAGTTRPVVQITDLDDTLLAVRLASHQDCEKSAIVSEAREAGDFALHLDSAVLRDGLYQVKVNIPLLKKSGSGYIARRHFRVHVTWNPVTDSPSARLGTRALHQIMNPRGAKSFAVRSSTRVLRRSTADLSSGIEWLLEIPIGDRDLATFDEDGFYALSFDQVKRALRGTALDGRYSGIPVDRLTIAAGTADTLYEVPQTRDPQLGPLQEQPILVRDHGGLNDSKPDGIWNEGDTLLFYASGTSLWRPSGRSEMEYYFSSNIYSFTRSFYLGSRSSGVGPRLQTQASLSGGSSVSTLMRYQRAEKDVLLRDTYFGEILGSFEENSGKEWFWFWGDTYKDSVVIRNAELALPQVVDLPGFNSNKPAKLAIGYFPYRSLHASITDQQNGNTEISRDTEDSRFWGLDFRFLVNGVPAVSDSIRLPGGQFVYSTNSLHTNGNSFELHMLPNHRQFDRFDGYSIVYPTSMAWNGESETWLPGALGGVRRFSVQNAPSALSVLKVNGSTPQHLVPLSSGAFSDSLDPQMDSRYHLFQWGNWKSIPDSSLHPWLPVSSGVESDLANLSGNFEYVILSPTKWLNYALRLKSFREGTNVREPFKTAVISLDQVWQQYGSGYASPMAVRDFLRMARLKWPNLRAALLVGDGHADYRAIRQQSGGPPEFPPFEKEDQANDDYFGVLDSGEAVFYGEYGIDIAIGRLPINSASDFETYLRKVTEYEGMSVQNNGTWRNSVIIAADDAMQKRNIDLIPGHTKQAERVAQGLEDLSLAKGYQIGIQRIYLLAYDFDMVYDKPAAAQDLIARMNQGALFTFYFGHGSPVDWADEGLLKPSSLPSLDNLGLYTILGSFACTVGRFDLPNMASLSELFLRAPNKGAIASIGAMRESFPEDNTTLADRILQQALIYGAPTLGEALMLAKGVGTSSYSSSRYNSERYVLLGEPVLNMPKPDAKIQLLQELDTLQALQKVHLSGTIQGGGESGKLQIQVLEGPIAKQLIQERPEDTFIENVRYQGRQIYSEIVEYRNGKFSTDFISPRKINFGDSAAQIRLWSWSDRSGILGRGLVDGIRLEGTSSDAADIQDTTPPKIHFRPCGSQDSLARDYASGAKIRLEIPACIEVMIADSVGLDLQENADEGISFEIPGSKDPWHPWPFLEQSGRRVMTRVRFTTSWKTGEYPLRVQALDIFGNRQEDGIDIELTGSLKTALDGVFNAPNPMGKSGTTFYFRNLAENHTAPVTIQIFGVDGRLVKVISNAKSGQTRWDGKDQWGRLLANGLYHYVVTCMVYPTTGNTGKPRKFEAKQKLVISR